MVPAQLLLLTGAVIVTVGGVVSAFGLTVTSMPAEAVLPLVSVAMAVTVWAPSAAVVVSQTREYGDAAIGEPRLTPSIWNCTPAMPRLSAALAVNVTEPVSAAPLLG